MSESANSASNLNVVIKAKKQDNQKIKPCHNNYTDYSNLYENRNGNLRVTIFSAQWVLHWWYNYD